MNKKAWLDKLYYDIGRQLTDFRVCTTFLKDGDYRFTKWIHYLEAQSNKEMIKECNQREQLKNEIILDLDKGDYKQLIQRLREDKLKFYAYSTEDNRARHVHLYFRNLDYWKKRDRIRFREAFISKYQGDISFKGDAHMIPIEYCNHWKTRKIKKLVDEVKGINHITEIRGGINLLK